MHNQAVFNLFTEVFHVLPLGHVLGGKVCTSTLFA